MNISISESTVTINMSKEDKEEDKLDIKLECDMIKGKDECVWNNQGFCQCDKPISIGKDQCCSAYSAYKNV